MKKQLTYDTVSYTTFLKETAIQVPILHTPFNHDVVLVEDALIKISEMAGVTQEEFQDYINDMKKGLGGEWVRDPIVDAILKRYRTQGQFKTHGYDQIGQKPFVYMHDIFPTKK